MNKETISKAIIYFLIPLQLFLFTFLVPPFQKPDEQQHFEKSLIISKGYLFCQKKSGNIVPIEKKYSDLIKNPYLDLMTHKKSAKLPLGVFFKDLFPVEQAETKINFNVDHLCGFPPISYLPQAIVLLVLSLFHASPILTIYLGRFVMAILSYWLFLLLYRKIANQYKSIILFTFALPMTLHQISSFSYDVANIMLALTFFTLIVNNLSEGRSTKSNSNMSFPRRRESRLNIHFKNVIIDWIPSFEGMTYKIKLVFNKYIKYFKIFFVLFLLLWSKKIGYETFFLFLFLLPLKIKPFIISTLIFIPFYILSKLNGSYDINYSLTNPVFNPVHQLSFLSNPINIIKVVIDSTVHRLGFYLQSLIGIFGWLEYGLDPLSYFLYGLFFIYSLAGVKLPDKLKLSRNKNILLFCTLILSYIFIVLLAFVFNTPSGTMVAQGVQGRYFIPFLPFIILFIVQIKDTLIFQKILYWSIIIFLIISTFYSIFHRYY
ncbi:DUF2142 domain-containing protein [bacterium]|nr:MAG: DUF2142 domain-containing protein [bacterium]